MTSPPLFDFKAGKVEFNASTGDARPLPGQGRVCLMQSSEDPALLGVQWLPRGSNMPSEATEELLIVPGDVTFSKVPYCDTGRIIQMRFESSGEKHLFWLQDAPTGDLYVFSDSDEEILRRANELASSFNDEDDEEAEDQEQRDAQMDDAQD